MKTRVLLTLTHFPIHSHTHAPADFIRGEVLLDLPVFEGGSNSGRKGSCSLHLVAVGGLRVRCLHRKPPPEMTKSRPGVAVVKGERQTHATPSVTRSPAPRCLYPGVSSRVPRGFSSAPMTTSIPNGPSCLLKSGSYHQLGGTTRNTSKSPSDNLGTLKEAEVEKEFQKYSPP